MTQEQYEKARDAAADRCSDIQGNQESFLRGWETPMADIIESRFKDGSDWLWNAVQPLIEAVSRNNPECPACGGTGVYEYCYVSDPYALEIISCGCMVDAEAMAEFKKRMGVTE